MKQYLELLAGQYLIRASCGETGRGRAPEASFGAQLRFDLSKGFPLVTTRKVFFKGVIRELLWFLAGDTNINSLTRHEVHIWDAWADEKGDFGPVYGAQWRAWETPDGRKIDQISRLIEQIRATPESRRHIVTAWNPAVLPDETQESPGQCPRGTRRPGLLPRALPILRCRAAAVLSTLPTLGGLPGRHGLQRAPVRPADSPGRPAVRIGTRGLRLDRRGLPHLFEPD